MKKIAILSNGKFAIKEDGKIRQATSQEVKSYLVSIVPAKKQGSKLAAVKYEDGFVFAKYDNKKVFKKRLAQVKQTEPVNSIDKANPSVKVPRNESKSKPEEFEGRSDVKSPTKVRKDEYNKGGDKGSDSHTNVVPRSKNNSGLEGSKKTNFESEVSEKATSGNPDSYVQKFKDSEAPAKAGSESNHAASINGIEIRQASEIYQKIKIAKKDEDEKEDSKEEKDDEKDEKSNKLPPWLKNKKSKDKKEDDKDSDEKKEKEDKTASKLAAVEEELNKFKAEVNRLRARADRQRSAVKLALAYRDISPDKYANADSFCEKIDSIAKTMDVSAAETAFEELVCISKAAHQKEQTLRKEASNNANSGVVTAELIGQKEGYADDLQVESKTDQLRKMLISHTSLGKKVAEFQSYENSHK